MQLKVAIVTDTPGAHGIEQLASLTGLPVHTTNDASRFDFWLISRGDSLVLSDRSTRKGIDVCVDFSSGESLHKMRYGGGFGQALCRAVNVRPASLPTVCDATAGLGRDAFALAALGCQVHMVERSSIVYALLKNGLQRARLDPDVAVIAARMSLTHADSTTLLSGHLSEPKPDVIYLDPMYPPSRKSASVKKGMRALQQLLAADQPETTDPTCPLLDQALCAAGKRVVVKRPSTAQPLTGPAPSGSVSSGKTRYDIYGISG